METSAGYVHSVRVPRLYKCAARALELVEKHEEGLKGAVFAVKHPNKKAITALLSTALQKSEEIDYVVRKSKIMETETRLQNQATLVKILVSELLWGKQRLGGECKPVVTVLQYQEKIEKALNKYSRKSSRKVEEASTERFEKPRYVRVNTLKITTDEAVQYLIEEGWTEKQFSELDSFSMYDFAKDDFVENLLVFAPKQTFYTHPLYLNGSFALQDKASCLAAFALKPRPGRTVLDACAAPGMKTTFLASIAGKESKIIAVEKSDKRCKTLREMLTLYDCDFVQVLNQDFTQVDPLQNEDVEYILVDPSCSGSGMYGRFDVPHSSGSEQDRLQNLSYYQQKVLCHAMKFPNVKRIVYSTCSINSEENEDVINKSLEFADNHTRFRLKKALPSWKHRVVNHKYDWAELCAKCDYDTDRTDGFFIAVLERVQKNRQRNRNGDGSQE